MIVVLGPPELGEALVANILGELVVGARDDARLGGLVIEAAEVASALPLPARACVIAGWAGPIEACEAVRAAGGALEGSRLYVIGDPPAGTSLKDWSTDIAHAGGISVRDVDELSAHLEGRAPAALPAADAAEPEPPPEGARPEAAETAEPDAEATPAGEPAALGLDAAAADAGGEPEPELAVEPAAWPEPEAIVAAGDQPTPSADEPGDPPAVPAAVVAVPISALNRPADPLSARPTAPPRPPHPPISAAEHRAMRPGAPEAAAWREAMRSAPTGRLHKLMRRRRLTDVAVPEARLDQIVRLPLPPGAHSVALISPKGGVGKTTLSFLLGSVLARVRRTRVLVVDANPDFGTLADLVPAIVPATISDLLRNLASIGSYEELSAYTTTTETGMQILAAPQDPREMSRLGREGYEAVSEVLHRHYDVVLYDCGTGFLDEVTQFALRRVDQVVLVSTAALVTTKIVVGAIDHLGTTGFNPSRVTLAVNMVGNDDLLDRRRLRTAMFGRVGGIVEVPDDEKVKRAMDLGEFLYDRLATPTRCAVKRLAAEVVGRIGELRPVGDELQDPQSRPAAEPDVVDPAVAQDELPLPLEESPSPDDARPVRPAEPQPGPKQVEAPPSYPQAAPVAALSPEAAEPNGSDLDLGDVPPWPRPPATPEVAGTGAPAGERRRGDRLAFDWSPTESEER